MPNLFKDVELDCCKNSLLYIEQKINSAVLKIYTKIKSGGKIMLCGNGGSAADAQHL